MLKIYFSTKINAFKSVFHEHLEVLSCRRGKGQVEEDGCSHQSVILPWILKNKKKYSRKHSRNAISQLRGASGGAFGLTGYWLGCLHILLASEFMFWGCF